MYAKKTTSENKLVIKSIMNKAYVELGSWIRQRERERREKGEKVRGREWGEGEGEVCIAGDVYRTHLKLY